MTEVEASRAPFVEHLRELRERVIRSVIAVAIAVGVAWFFHEDLFDWMMEPYVSAMSQRFPDLKSYINFRSLIEPFIVYFKTSLLVGGLAALPFVLLQAWLFVAPGLYGHERRMAVPFLFSTVLCFGGGVAFCRYVVLPPAVFILLGIGNVNTSPVIMMEDYFSFISNMLLVFGLLFELPVVISFLALVGIVSSAGLIRVWKYAVVVSFIVGAALTPGPDILSQVALALPLIFLYGVSIGIAKLIERGRGPQPEAAATPPEGEDA